MDYSIHDAIEAGFNKIIFVIRKDIEADFRERIGNRIEAVCRKLDVEIAYAFQDLNNVPGEVPEGRTKPWGTGQAVLAAKDCISSSDFPKNRKEKFPTLGMGYSHISAGNIFI